uniref:Uncharacterized protein n=1 Tax=Arundo donax TaxID=35708 RepID=A0A0A8Y2Y7_ARUDO
MQSSHCGTYKNMKSRKNEVCLCHTCNLGR